MDERINNYLQALSTLDEIPPDPTRLIETAPPIGHLPPPQVSATLAALMHYRGRLLWARTVRREVLDPLIQRVLIGNPQDEYGEGGYVPNMFEWEFYVEPCYTILTNRVTGEYIFRDEGVDDNALSNFDIYEQFQNPTVVVPVYQRVMQLFPSCDGVHTAIEYLRKQEILAIDRHGDISVTPLPPSYQDGFDRLASMYSSPGNRLQVAAVTGDWPGAHDAAQELGDARLISLTGSRASECQREWLAHLQEAAKSDELSRELLCALADAGGLEPYLPTAFANDTTSGTAAMLAEDDPKWCGQVHDAFQRLTQAKSCGYRAEKCAAYLVRHGHRTQHVIGRLSSLAGQYWHAVELALEYAPQMLPTLLQRGIRSEHPNDRLIAATVLALLDSKWSRNDLAAALHESNDVEETAECRIALRESIDKTTREVADQWEQFHCDNPPSDEARRRVMVQVMSRLFDKVMCVRQLVTPRDEC